MTTFPWDDYVFIDSETGGLSENRHPLIEWTYAVGLDDPITIVADMSFPYVLLGCEPEALKINKVLERYKSEDENGTWYRLPHACKGMPGAEMIAGAYRAWLDFPAHNPEAENKFLEDIKGKTWVGANPDFDVRFLSQYYNPEPLTHHHRLFDIEAYYAGQQGLHKIPGLGNIEKQINEVLGHYDLPLLTESDHTSRNDVISTREIFAFMVGQLNILRQP